MKNKYKNKVIKLNDIEQGICVQIAKARYKNARDNNIKNRNISCLFSVV